MAEQLAADAPALVEASAPKMNYRVRGDRVRVQNNFYKRWWKDPETTRLAEAIAQHYMIYWHSPVLKMALRYLSAHPATPTDVKLIQATRQPWRAIRESAKESSWQASASDLETLVALMQRYDLTAHDIKRLAIRALARSLGLLEKPHGREKPA